MNTTSPSDSEGLAVTLSKVFPSGFIDITALMTLIGSDIAEQLVLGNRGAAGLAWVGMSLFGSLSAIRASFAASIPGWLRQMLGIKDSAADAAVGLTLHLSSKYMGRECRARKNLGEAIGVLCQRRKKVKLL